MDLVDSVLEAGEVGGGGFAGDGVALVVEFLGEEFGGGCDDGGGQGDLAQGQHLGGGALAGAGVVGALGDEGGQAALAGPGGAVAGHRVILPRCAWRANQVVRHQDAPRPGRPGRGRTP
ncbi:hypothetical protein [Kitasatospora indigofera]|uniref:hypothetical protein n=1 Tax=Kitasatospora indigofera TaxID=67307 RepID=UPI0036A51929